LFFNVNNEYSKIKSPRINQFFNGVRICACLREREREREAERQRGREAERQSGRAAERQSGRAAERQRIPMITDPVECWCKCAPAQLSLYAVR